MQHLSTTERGNDMLGVEVYFALQEQLMGADNGSAINLQDNDVL